MIHHWALNWRKSLSLLSWKTVAVPASLTDPPALCATFILAQDAIQATFATPGAAQSFGNGSRRAWQVYSSIIQETSSGQRG